MDAPGSFGRNFVEHHDHASVRPFDIGGVGAEEEEGTGVGEEEG